MPRPRQPVVLQKRCTLCGEIKPITAFGYVSRVTGQIKARCRPCWQIACCKAWAERHPEKKAAATTRWHRSQGTAFRFAKRAMHVVRRAIDAGVLVRPSACEQCGKACKPDGAHADYREPLVVRWLCRSCHALWDRYEPKIAKLITPATTTERAAA